MTAPNIVLLICDDMTFEQLQRMPQLQKLSLTGVNFLNANCTTAVCQPGRMTFMTGQYSHNHGLLDNSSIGYPIDHTTMLAYRLQQAGYQTCHVGKYLNSWVISDPIPAGWNDWHYINPSQYYSYSINDNGVTTTVGTALTDYHTTVCNARALAYLATATQPFYMQVEYKAPHHDTPTTDYLNSTPDPRYSGVTPSSNLAPRLPNFNVPMGTPPAYMAHAAMDSTKIASVDSFWRGQTECLYSVDRSIQAIVAACPANTVFIFSCDHGYMHGEGRDPANKMVPYLPDIHIPLIIAGPSNLVAQGSVCTQLVSQLDVAPTIYALSGATSTRTMDGVSLVPLLTNPQGAALRNSLLLEWLTTAASATGWNATLPINRSILTKTYLYTSYATGEQELYDFSVDPFLLTNQIGVAAYAGIQANLASQLAAAQNCTGASCRLM